jgi:hypothetical protein
MVLPCRTEGNPTIDLKLSSAMPIPPWHRWPNSKK